eukprot:167761-Pleurochrysis_carterae.AAC.2
MDDIAMRTHRNKLRLAAPVGRDSHEGARRLCRATAAESRSSPPTKAWRDAVGAYYLALARMRLRSSPTSDSQGKRAALPQFCTTKESVVARHTCVRGTITGRSAPGTS